MTAIYILSNMTAIYILSKIPHRLTVISLVICTSPGVLWYSQGEELYVISSNTNTEIGISKNDVAEKNKWDTHASKHRISKTHIDSNENRILTEHNNRNDASPNREFESESRSKLLKSISSTRLVENPTKNQLTAANGPDDPRRFTKAVIKETYSTKVYASLCLEHRNNDTQIVVFNSNTNAKRTITIGTSAIQSHKKWEIDFRTDPIPRDYAILDAHAYFVKPTCYGNFYHFWHDLYDGIYKAMKYAGDVKDGKCAKDAYFFSEEKLHNGDDCHKRDRYKILIEKLGGIYWDGYKTISTTMCFPKAVLGYDSVSSNVKRGELEQVVRNLFNVSTSYCTGQHPRIVIQDRKQRRIVNSLDLAAALKTQLNATVENIYFEDFSLAEQFQHVTCADVLIGVQGAGLAHAHFLPEGGGLLEVGWYNWPTGMFAGVAKSIGRKSAQLSDCKATISEHSWETFFKDNDKEYFRNKTREFILELTNRKPFWSNRNIWKFADCEIDIENAVKKVKSLL